jgi:hypothetical protein
MFFRGYDPIVSALPKVENAAVRRGHSHDERRWSEWILILYYPPFRACAAVVWTIRFFNPDLWRSMNVGETIHLFWGVSLVSLTALAQKGGSQSGKTRNIMIRPTPRIVVRSQVPATDVMRIDGL